jgi:Type VI secretion system effector, Hcp
MGSRRRYAAEQEPAPRRTVVQRSEKPGNGVLELQRSAGNKAVADRIEVARDKAGPTEPETKKGSILTLSGLGSFEVSSFSWGSSGGGGGGGVGGTPSTPTEVVITTSMSALGDIAPRLQKAAATGQQIEKADLERAGTSIHLKDCYVGSIQMGSGDNQMVTFTLNFGSIKYGDDEATGTPDKPG